MTTGQRLRRYLGATLIALAGAAPAAAFDDPDWPCAQRKVDRLSIAQMWAGPVPEDLSAWRADAELADTAARIAARRTGMDEVAALIAATERAKLPVLFSGIFALIDTERTRLVDGIVRSALKQRALSEKIDADQAALAAEEAAVRPDDFDALDRIEAKRDAVTWDIRIYDERRRSVLYVCESPVILEKRLFAVARLIDEAMAAQ
jgi:hypothetical protein